MNLILIITTACLLLPCLAEDVSQSKEEDIPESLNVAKNFRKALLEALEQLEKDETNSENTTLSNARNFEKDDLDGSDYDEDKDTKFGHKIRDKISKQERVITSFTDGGKAEVLVHSFTTNIQNNNNLQKEFKPSNEESSTLKYRSKLATDNAISASVTSPVTRNNQISKIDNVINSNLPKPTVPVTPKTTLTSPNPTVSTPVEEDESKAKVEDVQFIHAPLVAAFTVEQDDKGLPQKVIPIFGNKQSNPSHQLPLQNSVIQIQNSLEEKQRQLEQQIKLLQEQRRQHELLLQQQTLQRQRQIFEEQNRFKVQTNDINHFNNPNRFNIPIPQQNNFQHQNPAFPEKLQQFKTKDNTNRLNPVIQPQNDINTFSQRPTKDVSGSLVSFQPSISFEANGFTPITNHQNTHNNFNHLQINQQEVPIKPTINFQKAVSVPAHLTQQQLPNQYRDQIFNNVNDNYLQDFYYRQQNLLPPPPRGNRIYRQENQVGNFGINNDFTRNQFPNRFNPPVTHNFNSDLQNVRYSQQFNPPRSNFSPNRYQIFNNPAFQHSNIDNRLKNLIYQSGLGQGRAQEDFNIISKVLALDHTGVNYQQNFLGGETNISEKRIPFKT